MAAAIMNVPASMRSGMIVYSQPCSSLTPSMVIRGVPCAGDPGPAGVEEVGQVVHLRLAGGRLDDGRALGQRGGHHDVGGAEDGRAERPAQEQLAPRAAAWP